jgi:oxygen-independent coproporphyrinogen-3 oxidase
VKGKLGHAVVLIPQEESAGIAWYVCDFHSALGANNRRRLFVPLNEYINGVLSGEEYSENEILTSEDKYNDLIITALRTKWGLDINLIEPKFLKHFHAEAEKFIKENHLQITPEGKAILTHSGIFISDYIMRELIVGAE